MKQSKTVLGFDRHEAAACDLTSAETRIRPAIMAGTVFNAGCTENPPRALPVTDRLNPVLYVVALLLIIVGTLIVYKGTSALTVIEKVQDTGTFAARVNVVPVPGDGTEINVVARSLNYFVVIWPALLFGILISGAVRVLEPPRWLRRALDRGPVSSQLAGGLAGAPLMLCSCCVAPIFSGLYERSSRLGPALALMLAAPSLNPAALALTFMLFDYRVATTRLVAAGLAVLFTGMLADHFFSLRRITLQQRGEETRGPLLTMFVRSCAQVGLRTVPLIVVGVFVSMIIASWLPATGFSEGGQILTIVIIALIAIPLALPTFFEIPLALVLLSAGAPVGAAVAMLIAGPAINLPSLFTIARSTNWRVAASVAFMTFTVAVVGGLLVSLI